MEDKPTIQKVLRAHVLLRVKGELDQFAEGLKTCGILDAVVKYPSLMGPCFLWMDLALTPGELLWAIIIMGQRVCMIHACILHGHLQSLHLFVFGRLF